MYRTDYSGTGSVANFMYRVYGWMTAGLFLTAGTAYAIFKTPALFYAIFRNPVLFFGLLIAQVALVISLSGFVLRISAATAALLFAAYSILNGITLSGTLVRTGPALFEIGTTHIKHWFDGYAMLYAFEFNNGTISYRNKMLRSEYYKKAQERGSVDTGFSGEKKSFLSKMKSFVSQRPIYDNGNVNIMKLGSHYTALTETPFPVAFQLNDLTTIGIVTFDDSLSGHTSTAHPIIDPATGESFNILTEFGNTSYYHVYRIAQGSTKRECICSIDVKKPSYIHSFALTKQYILLIECPLRVKPLDLAFSSKPYIENFVWNGQEKTMITLIDRSSGAIADTYCVDPFFMFHTVNAHQVNQHILLDLISYEDASVINETTVEFLRNPSHAESPSYFTRITIDLENKTACLKKIHPDIIEIPTINNTYQTKPYSFMYAVSNEKILKLSINNGSAISWTEFGCYPGEAIFVARPNSNVEDDGVILSVVLDSIKKKSFMLILDAKTWKEVARAYMPHHIPFGFHGKFFSN